MSEFSNLLYQYVHDKHINISRLARNCGIQTSIFHQYMNGKRALHKDDEPERIMCYLQLSPGERAVLLEAYDIIQIGPERYAGRKKAEWFIRSLPEIERRRAVSIQGDPKESLQEYKHFNFLRNRQAMIAFSLIFRYNHFTNRTLPTDRQGRTL